LLQAFPALSHLAQSII